MATTTTTSNTMGEFFVTPESIAADEQVESNLKLDKKPKTPKERVVKNINPEIFPRKELNYDVKIITGPDKTVESDMLEYLKNGYDVHGFSVGVTGMSKVIMIKVFANA